MDIAKIVVRSLLGLIFTVFGLNGFLHFIPLPQHEGQALNFMMGLMAAPYFFPVLKGVEVITGLALLSGRFVPLALLILAPIVVNIFLFHTVLAPGGAAIAILVMVLELATAWFYRDAFEGVLKMK